MLRADILKEIIKKKRERINLAKQQFSEEELKAKLPGLPSARPFREAVAKRGQICLIAEIKKQSPSGGILRRDFNPRAIAQAYQEAGAQAISVLTEEDYFAGNISYIEEVKSLTQIPVLRKDFILEPYQIYESRYFGSDAVLLIADLLSKDKLSELIGVTDSLGMDCLVEAHTEKELKKVLSLKSPIIGINNRSLHTLEVDFKITEKLFPLIPKDRTVVVESGIKSRDGYRGNTGKIR